MKTFWWPGKIFCIHRFSLLIARTSKRLNWSSIIIRPIQIVNLKQYALMPTNIFIFLRTLIKSFCQQNVNMSREKIHRLSTLESRKSLIPKYSKTILEKIYLLILRNNQVFSKSLSQGVKALSWLRLNRENQ